MMRSLDECKAEVFRRSAEKILRHKKIRRRVVSVCVPICLICAICLAAPGMGNRDKIAYGQVADGENSAGTPEKEQQSEDQQPPQRRATVSVSGENWSLPDANAAKLFVVLEGCFHAESAKETAGEALPEGTLYEISFPQTAPDGGEAVYYLQGNRLWQKDGENQVVITQSQREEILSLLNDRSQ